jgi:hypothetical protein
MLPYLIVIGLVVGLPATILVIAIVKIYGTNRKRYSTV